MRLSYSIPLLLTCLILSGCQTDNSAVYGSFVGMNNITHSFNTPITNPLNASSPDKPYTEQYGDDNSVGYLRMNSTAFLCRQVVGVTPYNWGSASSYYLQEIAHRGKTPADCYRFVHGDERMKGFTPTKSTPSPDLCKLVKPFSVSKFSAEYNTDFVGSELKSRNFPLNSCIEAAGLTPPKPLQKLSSEDLCKTFKPFSKVSADYNTDNIGLELKARNFPLKSCMEIAGLTPPESLEKRGSQDLCKTFKPFIKQQVTVEWDITYWQVVNELKSRAIKASDCLKLADGTSPETIKKTSSESLCRKFSPFDLRRFNASYNNTEMANELQRRNFPLRQCINLAGKKYPKSVKQAQWQELCSGNSSSVIEKEKRRRKITEQDCKFISNKLTFNDETFLKVTPSKRVVETLNDIKLCKFLKYKTPPHLQSESKKRGLRCDRLLALDAFDKAN